MSSALTLYDASAPLLSQRFTTVGSFPQSGSWSWVGLIDSGVRGAVKVLSRYSAAGVDPYTVIVGQVVCSSFKLTVRSSERLESAIIALKSMNTVGNMLHFGFGVDSVVRNLAATEEGGILVALCAAMTESFHLNHAANILWELVRTFKAPEKQTPSPLQWKTLLKACAGTLAETEFPKIAEHFMHLHPNNDRLSVGRYELKEHPEARGVSSPDTIAEALLAIGKVSTGELLSISIVGGGDAGWLGAVAQWIFDLRVAVFDSEGELLHATAAHQNQPQVQIFFIKPSEEVDDDKIVVRGHVYKLRDVSELFHSSENEFGSALVCSRVPWSNALSLTFGREFERLMEMKLSFGKALVSAGQVFGGVAGTDPAVQRDERLYCQTYFRDGRGKGFIAFATALFPELQPLRDSLNVTLPGSFFSACENYESSRAHIKTGCGCSLCKKGVDEGLFEDNFCLVLLMEAIIVIVQSMSGVSASPTLYPMRSGLEAFYRRQLKLHESETLEARIRKYGTVGAVLEFNSTECDEWNIEESVAVRRVIDAARLFSGRDIESIGHDQVAISLSGVVVFLTALIDGGLPVDTELMGRCTVVNGHIEMHGRSYAHLEDLSDYDLAGMDYRNRREGGIAPDPLFDPSPLIDDFEKVELIAKEEVRSVKVGLSFQDAHGGRSVVLGPAGLTERVLQATGLVECGGKNCDHTPIEFETEVSDCVKIAKTPDGQCETWLFRGNAYGRLVALVGTAEIQPMYHQVFQHHECMRCCIRAAELSQYEKAIIVSKRPALHRKRIRGQ
ncbi:MAG: hypothetical protein M1839_002566 [Geoglossum umbratile]|nr:MAG: hypothetical protein M1839_002566 [Geoglossum umbratile]